MTPRWEEVKAIYFSAIKLQPELREQYVREAAANSPTLMEKVLSLLRWDSQRTIPPNPFFPVESTGFGSSDRDLHVLVAGAAGGTGIPRQQEPSPHNYEAPRFIDRIGPCHVIECIGQGGMGVVYRAYDEDSGEVVALKTLPKPGAAALHRFKQEFRSFTGLDHPNLVPIYKLVSDGSRWGFTMKLVNGQPFLAYLASGADSDAGSSKFDLAVNLERIRGAFQQLATGVAALHAAGNIHRDLKPSNVLVTPKQRVIILDFGLGAQLKSGLHEPTDDHIAGSIAYMSPEQGEHPPVALTPATDWYSVGVMLYQALTGRLPFEGKGYEILIAKRQHDPEPPVSVVPSVPDDLNALCCELLRRDPAARPDGPAILARLGTPFERAHLAPGIADAPFMGRRQELAALRDAYETMRRNKPLMVYIEGVSGAGKTALAQRFLDEIASETGAVVLLGKCHEDELVPFKALDRLIDSLARHLKQLSRAEIDQLQPRDIRSLTRVFPTLLNVDAFKDAPIVGGAVEVNPVELRRRAAVALRELLARLGDRHPLFLFIDDVQWGDVDSASLLADILTPPDPPVFLGICCYRSEDIAGSPFFTYLQECRRRAPDIFEERRISIGQLSPVETRELADRLMESTGTRREAFVDGIVRESAGRPILIYELIEHVRASTEEQMAAQALTLSDVLWSRIEALPEESARVLEIVAIAARPIDFMEAREAAGVTTDEHVLLQPLKTGRLIRLTPVGSIGNKHRLEVYHDRVRLLVLEHLPAAELESRHRQLAEVFSASGGADAEIVAHHLHRGGLLEQAADYYSIAASDAAKKLAFDHASASYRQALALKSWGAEEDCKLRTQLGDALNNAGRGGDAAREYLAAAANTTPTLAVDLQHRAALALLTSGHVDEGLSCLAPIMKSDGTRLAGAPWRAFVSLLARRVQLRLRGTGFAPRPEESISPDLLRRMDRGWSVVLGLSVIDPIRGADFQTRSLLLALRAGEPFRIARALAVEAGHVASSGAPQQARKILSEAERLAAGLNRPYATAMVELARGTINHFTGNWKESVVCCRAAAAKFREHCTGTAWEIDTANAFSLWSLTKMGDVRELSRICPALLKEAQERSDLYALTNLSTHVLALVRLAMDDAGSARDELNQVMSNWSQNGYHVQHHDALLAFVPIELYCGNPQAAWNRIQAEWSAFRWSLLSHVQDLRIQMLQLRSYCALSMAATVKDRPRFLSIAMRNARRLRKERLRLPMALAEYVAGTAAFLQGDVSTARNRLAAAVSIFDEIDAYLHAAATRERLAQIVGGSEAEELRNSAREWFHQQGIKAPQRMIDAFAPGFLS
jgi:eukaryotic-like serine/threonine-protein kinase